MRSAADTRTDFMREASRSDHNIRFQQPEAILEPITRASNSSDNISPKSQSRSSTPPSDTRRRNSLGQRLSRTLIGLTHTDHDVREKEKEDPFTAGPPAKRAFKGCKAMCLNVPANQNIGDSVTIEVSVAGVRILAADPGSAVLPSTSTHGRLVRLFRGRTPATVMRSSLSVPIPAATSGSLSTSPSDDLRTPSREESTPNSPTHEPLNLAELADVEEGAPDDPAEDNDWSLDSVSVSSSSEVEWAPQDRLIPVEHVKSCWAAKDKTLRFKWRASPRATTYTEEYYQCDAAEEAMLLFGKIVTYLVAKKQHKEKEVLGNVRKEREVLSSARKELRKEKKQEKTRSPELTRKEKKEKEKEKEWQTKYYRTTSAAPIKNVMVPYAAGVLFTLAIVPEGLVLSSSSYMTRTIPFARIKSVVGKNDKVYITHSHCVGSDWVEEIFFCDEPSDISKDYSRMLMWLAKAEKKKNRIDK